MYRRAAEVTMKGIEKEIDGLGRVVIPINFRKRLGLKSKDKVIVSIKESVITISAAENRCALCGSKLNHNKKIELCEACIAEVKSIK